MSGRVAPALPPGVFRDELAAPLAASLDRLAGLLGPVDAVIVGWATVDLDRATAAAGGAFTELPADALLGAHGRLRVAADRDPPLLFLEPSTEGRLAASLARHAEGPIAVYLLVGGRGLDRLRVVGPASGVRLSRPAEGPFGRSVLALDLPVSGPHLVVATAAPRGTIVS